MTERLPPRPAALLGAAGLIPFLGLAALSHSGDPVLGARAAQAALAYGAVILSFLGGCRWGFAAAGMGEGPGLVPLLVAVGPSLLGWGAVLAGGALGLACLAAGLLLLLASDLALTKAGGAPRWWPVLRLPLSLVAAASLGAAALA